MRTFTAVLSNKRIIVPTRSEADSLHVDGFGYWSEDNLLVLEPSEALFNIEKQKIIVICEKKNKNLSFQEVLHIFSEENSDTWINFIVFKDLRSRGFIIRKEPMKNFYLLFERGMYKKEPARYRITILSEGSPKNIIELINELEETETDSLGLKFAVVDRRGEIVYYGVNEAFKDGL
jgi:tRNA-intron endonuclease